MSLRFLTRRRDRDRSGHTAPTSTSLDKQPASACVILPRESIAQGKGTVPSEVQIISWDPRHLEATGREVHIRSRGEHASSTVPVYAAFAAPAGRRASAILTASETPSTMPGFRDADGKANPHSTRARPRTAPRSYNDRSWGDSRTIFDPITSAPTATDAPRSEHVEELNPSWAIPSIEKGDGKRSLPVRLASKARRAKSRSQHPAAADDSDLDQGANSSSFVGMPASMPSNSRSGFQFFHHNASVQSLASLASLSGGGKESLLPEQSDIPGSTSLLSRTPSKRRLRRSKNASSADIHSAAPRIDAEVPSSRSRSSSLSAMAPKFLRSKESRTEAVTSQVPSTASRSKVSRAAPPSAWRPDIITSDGIASSYTSDNETSVGHSFSSGHFQNPNQRPAHRDSGDTAVGNSQLLSPTLHAKELSRVSDTARSPTISILDASPRAKGLGSPDISGLPLPPTDSPATPASLSSLFASQLFKTLGPPPFGLPPHRFEDRVVLIHNYIQSQVPPLRLVDTTTISTGNHRSSLPPATRTRARALEDEFDKLECQTEQEMLKLAPSQKGDMGIGELRLEDAFLEARRRCGVDSSRSHFESNLGQGSGMAGLKEASSGRTEGQGLGLGLTPAPRSRRRGAGRRPITAPEAQEGSTVDRTSSTPPPIAFSRAGREGSRPSTARTSGFTTLQQVSENSHSLPRYFAVPPSTEQGLFTPQSFSSKPPVPLYNPHFRRGSSEADSSSSHTHRSSSSLIKSPPLFGYPMQPSHRMRGSQDTKASSCESLADGHPGLVREKTAA